MRRRDDQFTQALECIGAVLLLGAEALRLDDQCAVRRNALVGFLGGALQVGAYWIVIWALALAPMAMVSSLRETSVLFAALISTFVLREGFGVWRFVSASLVTLGLVLSRER